MRSFQIKKVLHSAHFQMELSRVSKDVQIAAERATALLMKNPRANSLRLHTLEGHDKPTLWKIDVFPNHSWQITLEVEGDTAHFRRIARHKEMNRRPR